MTSNNLSLARANFGNYAEEGIDNAVGQSLLYYWFTGVSFEDFKSKLLGVVLRAQASRDSVPTIISRFPTDPPFDEFHRFPEKTTFYVVPKSDVVSNFVRLQSIAAPGRRADEVNFKQNQVNIQNSKKPNGSQEDKGANLEETHNPQDLTDTTKVFLVAAEDLLSKVFKAYTRRSFEAEFKLKFLNSTSTPSSTANP